MTEWFIGLLLVIGTGFIVTSSIGLLRMPDFYTRMHGPTKASTLGLICVLLASLVYFTLEHQFLMVRELLVIVFLFLTAPVSAHLLGGLGRARRRRPRQRRIIYPSASFPETFLPCQPRTIAGRFFADDAW